METEKYIDDYGQSVLSNFSLVSPIACASFWCVWENLWVIEYGITEGFRGTMVAKYVRLKKDRNNYGQSKLSNFSLVSLTVAC